MTSDGRMPIVGAFVALLAPLGLLAACGGEGPIDTNVAARQSVVTEATPTSQQRAELPSGGPRVCETAELPARAETDLQAYSRGDSVIVELVFENRSKDVCYLPDYFVLTIRGTDHVVVVEQYTAVGCIEPGCNEVSPGETVVHGDAWNQLVVGGDEGENLSEAPRGIYSAEFAVEASAVGEPSRRYTSTPTMFELVS